MENKCNKYEGYFLFSDEKALDEHIKTCPDCQKERAKEERLSELLKDSRFEYKRLVKRNLNKSYAKVACMLFLFLGIGTTTTFNLYNSSDFGITKAYNTQYSSVIENSGLPTDEYGFFDYN